MTKLHKTTLMCFSFTFKCDIPIVFYELILCIMYEGWNFNTGNYSFTNDTKYS